MILFLVNGATCKQPEDIFYIKITFDFDILKIGRVAGYLHQENVYIQGIGNFILFNVSSYNFLCTYIYRLKAKQYFSFHIISYKPFHNPLPISGVLDCDKELWNGRCLNILLLLINFRVIALHLIAEKDYEIKYFLFSWYSSFHAQS